MQYVVYTQVNKKYYKYASIMIKSFFKYNSNKMFIYSADLSDEQKHNILKISSNISFLDNIEVSDNDNILLNKLDYAEQRFDEYFKVTFSNKLYKYIDILLDTYKTNVLKLDADVVILDTLDFKDFTTPICGVTEECGYEYNIGVILFNKNYRFYDKFINFAKKSHMYRNICLSISKMKRLNNYTWCPEQSYLYFIHANTELGKIYNTMYGEYDICDNTKAIHFKKPQYKHLMLDYEY